MTASSSRTEYPAWVYDSINDMAYDESKRTLVWAVQGRRRVLGREVGTINKGYRHVSIQRKGKGRVHILVHRIVWYLEHGAWPANQLDHINHDKLDNRPSNLREATAATNGRNQSLPSNNTSGHVGVSWHKPLSKWLVRVSGKHHGVYTDKAEAIRVAKAARKALGFHPNHGRTHHHE